MYQYVNKCNNINDELDNKHMDDTVGYSYMEQQIRQYKLGGLEVAGCFTSALETQLDSNGNKN